MASRKQKAKRRRHATQHTRRDRPVLPEGWANDDRWLGWTRDYGLDVCDRDQLLDSVAVGLTVLCWRNTSLENVHAGVERDDRLERLGKDVDDPKVNAEEDQARRSFYEALDANWDMLAEIDPDESVRVGVLLEGREQGFGIPDDIMMRLNISTAMDVRDVLDEVLPEAVIEPGTELQYDRRTVPDHVAAVVELLEDRDRRLIVGGTAVTAGQILGNTWDEYREDLYRKISVHIRFCDLIGARRTLWYTGLSGIIYASSWFPNPWWDRAVGRLRQAIADNRLSDAYYSPDRMANRPLPDDAFWEKLLSSPAGLNGPQTNWVQGTRIRDFIRDVRDDDRAELGPLNDQDRFPGLAVMF